MGIIWIGKYFIFFLCVVFLVCLRMNGDCCVGVKIHNITKKKKRENWLLLQVLFNCIIDVFNYVNIDGMHVLIVESSWSDLYFSRVSWSMFTYIRGSFMSIILQKIMLQSNTFLWIEVAFLWKVHKVSGELLKYSFNIVTMYISNEHFFLWELFIYFLFQQIINERQTLIYLLDYLQKQKPF